MIVLMLYHMNMRMHKNSSISVSKLLISSILPLYMATIGYELVLNIIGGSVEMKSSVGAVTQIPLALIPLVGSVSGFIVAFQWGGLRTRLGRALVFYSIGIMSWGLGVVIWLWYIYVVKNTEVPYPSVADYVYMLAQVFWYLGTLSISGVIGANFGLKSKYSLLKILSTSLVGVILSYVLLVTIARGGEVVSDTSGSFLKTFFDYYYPIATSLSLTLTLGIYFLARKYLGGVYRTALLVIFFGFFVQFLGDFLYSYSTRAETYFNGHWSDILFTTAMLVLSVGVSMYRPIARSQAKTTSRSLENETTA